MKSFGVPLSQAPRIKGKLVPNVLDMLISHLEAHALGTEGLFRVSGNALRVRELIAELDSGEEVDLFKYEHTTIAETLKKYFNELPEPIVPPLIDQQVKSLFGGIRRPAEEIIPEMKFAVDSLSEINFAVLERLSKMLAGIVAHSDKNKMSLPNIVTCIAPTMRFTPAILTYSIVHHKHFFEANPVAPPEELQLLAEGATTLMFGNSASPASATGTPSLSSNGQQRLSLLLKHSRKGSAPPGLSPTTTRAPEKEEGAMNEKIHAKEEMLKEKQRLKDDVRRQLKDEFNKERQIMVDEVMREKDLMKAEMHREKGFLKELYSKEKRLYKDEARRLRKELDMARTVIQTLKDKIDTFAEVNYELERKLKKQQLRNKAQQLDIEGLHRKIIKTNNHMAESSKISPRISANISSSFEHDDDSDPSSDDSLPKRDDIDDEGVKKKYDEKRPKSRSKRRSVYMTRSGSSSTIDAENIETMKDKKDKARELLKKNTTKLLEASSLHSRRSASSLSSGTL